MRVKIIPHGVLRKTWPLDYECEADTPAQAINAICTVHRLKAPPAGRQWQVRLVGCPSVASIYSPLQTQELHVVPDFSGGGGAIRIVIGVVLVAASFTPGLQGIDLAAATSFSDAVTLSGLMFSVGMTLALGGILELISPAPKTVTPAQTTSNYLGAPQNTVAANTRIPIGFGRYPVYGQFLSFNVQADLSVSGNADLRRSAAGYVNYGLAS